MPAAILLPWLLNNYLQGRCGVSQRANQPYLSFSNGVRGPVRAGLTSGSKYRVGVCVVRFKVFIVAGGLIAATAFSAPVGQSSTAGAADAGHPPIREAVTVPEFVPILNFSQFVLATEQFGVANRDAAAQSLSAKFAAASDVQHIELNQGPQRTPAIVETAISLAVPDPAEKPVEPSADPLKVATAAVAEEAPETAAAEEEALPAVTETKPAAQPRSKARFRPAMGLGMAAEPEETAAPVTSTKPKVKKKNAAHVKSESTILSRLFASSSPASGAAENAAPAIETAPPKPEYQIGIPGQSMEPLISTCAKSERTCYGSLCGC